MSTPHFFLHAFAKFLNSKQLPMADRPPFSQNIESKDFKGNIFRIIELDAIRMESGAITTAVHFWKAASMTLLFSFCIQGQGYASQRLKKSCGKRGVCGGGPYSS
jgi:hypothetical protein